MKLPKKIEILGIVYKIYYDKKVSGAEFFLAPPKIILNPTYGDMDLKRSLLHEVSEIILIERKMRYQYFNDGNNKLLFSFNHNEFDNFIQDLAPLLELKCLKEKK